MAWIRNNLVLGLGTSHMGERWLFSSTLCCITYRTLTFSEGEAIGSYQTPSVPQLLKNVHSSSGTFWNFRAASIKERIKLNWTTDLFFVQCKTFILSIFLISRLFYFKVLVYPVLCHWVQQQEQCPRFLCWFFFSFFTSLLFLIPVWKI